MRFDYGDIKAIVENERAKAVSLSASSGALILTALLFMDDIWRWVNYDGDDDVDIIEGWLALAIGEVMTSAFLAAVVPCAGAVPEGGLLCDGATYDRVDYPALYDAIDSVYVINADTFKVPDMRNRFVYGTGTNDIDDKDGAETHTLSVSEMPSHRHTLYNYTFGIDVEGVGIPDPTGVGNPPIDPFSTTYAGGGNSHNNMPPYLALAYFIVAI